ncbi:phosphatase PAP2 family protein, partial [Leptospira sp. SA-E8]|uniref:phosphatase PAP2 family protein n=1 Tax=Leptospira sp. SA-E8 TaxID=3422259 RepID=UPI003EB75C00
MIALNRAFSHLPDRFWALLSLLGTGWAVYALIVPALWRMPRLMLAWICAAPLASLAAHAGKALVNSPRPLKVLGPDVLHTIGPPLYHWAMPSGHTITAFGTAAAIYFSLRPAGRWRWAWLFVLAFGVGCSRIAFAAHWPADVALGAALGLLCGMSGAWLAACIPPRHLREQAWLMCSIDLVGLPVLYVLCSGV